MLIVHVTPVYPPRGGMGTVASDYVEELAKRGEKMMVYTPAYGEYVSHGNVIRLKGLFWGNAALLPQLFFALKNADLVHLHYPFYGGAIFVALASLIWRVPMVVTFHMRTKASGWLGVVFKVHRFCIEPFILWCAHKIFVSSLDYARSVGLRGGRVQELPFGVDAERFSPDGDDVRQRLGIKDDACVFLFVGGLDAAHYFKGVDVLLRAAARLPREREWKIIVVGEGGNRAVYENLAKSLGLSNHVIFAGRVSGEELPQYYRSSDVHLLPSVDRSEAFGMVTLEAAASGIPSIVSDLPGVRTLVRNGETGFVSTPRNIDELWQKMSWFIEHPVERKEMGRAARKMILEAYTHASCISRLQDFYKAVTVKKSR